MYKTMQIDITEFAPSGVLSVAAINQPIFQSGDEREIEILCPHGSRLAFHRRWRGVDWGSLVA